MKLLKHSASLFLLIVCSAPTMSQEAKNADKGIFQSREHYFEFMERIKNLNDPELNAMIPAMNDVIMASHNLKKAPFGSPFHSSKSWMLRILDNDGVRKEIEMVDFQYEELKESSREITDQMTESIRELVYESEKLDAEKIKQRINKIKVTAERRMEELILPDQQSRLKQLLVHGRMIREPLIKVLTTGTIAKELELTDKQKSELRTEWRKIEDRLNDDIAKLKTKARKELGSHLTPVQERKFEELFGDDFRFKENEPDRKAREQSQNEKMNRS